MKLLFLLTTALTVSVDSFVCGLSLQAQYKGNYKMLLGICLSVFTICFFGALCGKSFGLFLQTYAGIIGGVILIIVAFINLFSANDNTVTTLNSNSNNSIFKKSLAVGLAVGFDGGVACFSLTTAGYNAFLVVFLITLTHVITLFLAVNVITAKIQNKLKPLEFLSPLILAIMGTFKAFSFI